MPPLSQGSPKDVVKERLLEYYSFPLTIIRYIMKRRDFIALTGLGAVLATVSGFSASADEPKKKVLYYDYSAGFIHPPTVDNDGKLGVCGSFLKEFGEKNGIEVVCDL